MIAAAMAFLSATVAADISKELEIQAEVTAFSEVELFVYLIDKDGYPWRAEFASKDYPRELKAGYEVRVKGFRNEAIDPRPRLHGAVVTKVVSRKGRRRAPAMTGLSDFKRHPVIDPEAVDLWGRVVKIKGRIADVNRRDRFAQVLVMDDNGSAVQIYFYRPYDKPIRDYIQVDARIEAVGVALWTPLLNPWTHRLEGISNPLLYVETMDDIVCLEKKPFWTLPRTAVLFGAVIFVFIVAVFWVRSYERAKADAARRERLRLSHDLHDGFQQLLAGSMFRLEAAMNFLPEGAEKAREQLEKVCDSLYHTQTGLRAALWSMTEESEGPGALSELVKYAASRLAHWEGVVNFTFKGDERSVSRNISSEVLLFLQEAVGNALKHGHASKVAVKFSFRSSSLVISVRDNGCGFDLATLDVGRGHLGLRTMRERVDRLQGHFSITSEIGKGVIVVARIPYGGKQ